MRWTLLEKFLCAGATHGVRVRMPTWIHTDLRIQTRRTYPTCLYAHHAILIADSVRSNGSRIKQ
jgi:hypothetical protein